MISDCFALKWLINSLRGWRFWITKSFDWERKRRVDGWRWFFSVYILRRREEFGYRDVFNFGTVRRNWSTTVLEFMINLKSTQKTKDVEFIKKPVELKSNQFSYCVLLGHVCPLNWNILWKINIFFFLTNMRKRW